MQLVKYFEIRTVNNETHEKKNNEAIIPSKEMEKTNELMNNKHM